MKAWEIISDGGIDALALNDRDAPTPGPGEVCIQVHASSINYRDLAIVEDPGPRGIAYPMSPNSDGAGEIVSVGPGVEDWQPGDRVMGCFFSRWRAGGITADAMASALGGAEPGVLAEQVVLPAGGIVRIPGHLSFEQAATLPCAGVTAWHAMFEKSPIKAGETVLLLGTGGVSVFAQQFANMAGARTIVTSSSDEKLARVRELGAWQTINYRTTPDWQDAVREVTGGAGADHIVEVGGPGTLQKSITAARIGGRIALIGILAGAAGAVQPVDIMRKSLTVNGIYVGSREMFKNMCKTIAAHAQEPVIDKVFDFEDARAAYHHMRAAGHFGKIVIRVAA